MAETLLTGLPISPGIAPAAPSFGDVALANLGRTFDPIISQVERNFRFGYTKDPNYDFQKYIGGQYADYADEFAALPNDQAAVNLRSQIDRSVKMRETLSMATTGQLLGAGFFDPVNYLGITFGGPALSLGRAALRTGVSVAAVETGRETLIQATDPVATAEETALNIASSALFGAAIGGVLSAPAVSRAQAFEATVNQLKEFRTLQSANENAANISPEMFASRFTREQRPLSAMDNASIEAELRTRLGEAEALRTRAGNDESLQELRDQAVQIERDASMYREELGLRYMEDSGFDLKDPYGLPANWFTDSVFYRAITNPMKRALQSNIMPTPVKKKFFDLAHDMTLAVNMNTFGIRSEPSVHLLTAISHGDMARLERDLKSLYGQEQQNPLSFDDWISSAARKRILGDTNLSEAEIKAVSVLEDNFGRDVTARLEDNGMIATPRGRENRIRIINEEIDALAARREGASQREIDIIDARIEALKKDTDAVTRSVFSNEAKITEYGNAMQDIADWNKTWMAKQVAGVNARLAENRKKFESLDATFKTRGLTAKQQKFYDDLNSRIKSGEETIAYFNGLTEKINAAKTVDDLINIRKNLDVTETMAAALDTLTEGVTALRARLDQAKASIDAASAEPPREAFFPRFYKLDKIRANREEFTKILIREFEKNPYVYDFDPATGDYVRVKLSVDPTKLRERAESTVGKILSEGEADNAGDIIAGLGRSKHFRSRKLDIPTAALIDYIELNPVSVLNSYNARVRPRTIFQEKFGKDYRGVVTEMELDMIRAGAKDADINKMRVDFDALYRRIVSNVLDNPDAMNQKAAYVLRSMATFAFMGGAGLTSLGDFGRIVMQYELNPMLKGIKSIIDMDTVRRSGEETRLTGSALEYTLGMYRLENQISNNFVAPKLLNSAQNAFYVLNGLTPITIAFKKLSGLVMGHTIIDSSLRLVDGTISDADRLLLAKHGIDEEFARRLAKAPWQRNKEGLILPNTEQWFDHIEIPEINGKKVTVIDSKEDGSLVGKVNSKGEYVPAYYNRNENTVYFDRDYIEGPMFERKAWLKPRKEGVEPLPDIFKTPRQWSNFVMLHEINHSRFSAEDLGFAANDVAGYENAINKLALVDYRAAKVISDDLVDRYRVAINSGITNTVIHGTPADRPIITDGVVHLPMSVASKFGLKEDPFLRGYARIENGFLALPFQFYNFLFGSLNKTLAAAAHGQVKNRAIGAATMLGLSYMIMKAKTKESTWDSMSYQDQIARTIDMSGLLPFYSDLFYRTMHSTIALGGPNITGGFIQPKFKQRENAFDVVTDLAGAGPSWAANVGEGLAKVVMGDYGQGASEILRMLPGANLWFWKGEVSELAQAMRQ